MAEGYVTKLQTILNAVKLTFCFCFSIQWKINGRYTRLIEYLWNNIQNGRLMNEHKRSLNNIDGDDIKRLLTNYIFGRTQFTDLLTDKMQAIARQSIHQQINKKVLFIQFFLKINTCVWFMRWIGANGIKQLSFCHLKINNGFFISLMINSIHDIEEYWLQEIRK